MNRTAILGLLLAIVLPLTGYFIVKSYSDNNVHMPGRYFYDSVAVIEKNGRTRTDTLWHSVKNMTFTNQLGKVVTLDSLRGKNISGRLLFFPLPFYMPPNGKEL
jgi:protein SCO1/2